MSTQLADQLGGLLDELRRVDFDTAQATLRAVRDELEAWREAAASAEDAEQWRAGVLVVVDSVAQLLAATGQPPPQARRPRGVRQMHGPYRGADMPPMPELVPRLGMTFPPEVVGGRWRRYDDGQVEVDNPLRREIRPRRGTDET